MQTKFMISNGSVSVLKLDEDLLLDKLPPRVYNVMFTQEAGFFLENVKERLELPGKVYGTTGARAAKCISTYISRESSTGILLTGDKGTGKTLLMSVLANKAIDELNLPVILIKTAYAGTSFVSFIEAIGECVLVFDEFGKMYASGDRHNGADEVPQKALLSLMDGTAKAKRMVIMTENSEIDINEFMLNRPSRIYYHFRYKKLDEASVIGYCKDNEVRTDIVKDIIELARRSKVFSFDMLQSIVEEHLRFNGTVEEATADLNIDTREDKGAMLEIIKVMERHTEVEREMFESAFVSKPDQGYTYMKVRNIIAQGNGITKVGLDSSFVPQTGNFEVDHDAEQVAEDGYEEIYVRDSDLAYEKDGRLVYETERFVFVAKNIVAPRSNYFSYF